MSLWHVGTGRVASAVMHKPQSGIRRGAVSALCAQRWMHENASSTAQKAAAGLRKHLDGMCCAATLRLWKSDGAYAMPADCNEHIDVQSGGSTAPAHLTAASASWQGLAPRSGGKRVGPGGCDCMQGHDHSAAHQRPYTLAGPMSTHEVRMLHRQQVSQIEASVTCNRNSL